MASTAPHLSGSLASSQAPDPFCSGQIQCHLQLPPGCEASAVPSPTAVAHPAEGWRVRTRVEKEGEHRGRMEEMALYIPFFPCSYSFGKELEE